MKVTQATQQELWQLKLAILLFFSTIFTSFDCAADAQIIPDNTLGVERSTVTPQEVRDVIEGGAIRESLLFHSFVEFNINELQQVYFANPAGIENIFTRITGANSSSILGTLGVEGTANLYLMNPNGIIFGENAQLDVASSFTATTADSIIFENYEFSATNPTAPPLLTITISPGLQYGSNHLSRTIRSVGNLSVGQDLSLRGGNLDLENQLHAGNTLTLLGTDTISIRDSTTKPFVAAAGNNLVVQGNEGVDIFALNHPDSGFFAGGDILLRSANTVGGDAHYSSGGSFRIEQLDGSLGGLYSPYDPVIRANGNVSLANYFGASLHILAGGSVSIPGTILIFDADANAITENVTLSDGSTVVPIDGTTQPTLDIRAGIDWTQLGGLPGNTVEGFVFFFPNFQDIDPTMARADIAIADVAIFGDNSQVFLSNQYQPNSLLPGSISTGSISLIPDFGNAGAVVIDSKGAIAINAPIDAFTFFANGGDITFLADGDITLQPGAEINSFGLLGGQITFKSGGIISISSDIISASLTDVAGSQGGNIQIVGESVFVKDGAALITSTFGQADAGRITIDATDTISFTGFNSLGESSFVQTLVASGAEGNGGNISITANSVLLEDGANILNASVGKGDTGNITIESTDIVSFSGLNRQGDGSAVSNTVALDSEGNGGNILVKGRSIFLNDGAVISSIIASANGNAGNVTIDATDTLSFAGFSNQGNSSGVASSVIEGRGNGGNILVKGRSVLLNDGAIITTSTISGEGNAGALTIDATDTISLTDSFVTTLVAEETVGNGGSLSLAARSILLNDGAVISSSTFGEGNAGALMIQARDTISLTGVNSNGIGSRILSTVEEGAVGNGGSLSLVARSILLNDGAVISSSTFGEGNAGALMIQASDTVSINNSSVSSAVEKGATGNANAIRFQTGVLSLMNQAEILSSTSGQGDAGRIFVEATDAVSLDNSTLSTAVNEGAVAQNPAQIDIQTPDLSLNNQAQILASTAGEGQAGDIHLSADRVTLQSGSEVSAATSSQSDGGTIVVRARDVSLIGKAANSQSPSRLSVTSEGLGAAGSLQIDTERLFIQNAQATVQAFGTATAGNLRVSANEVTLDNGTISADTESGSEGNISLALSNSLYLQNQSQISATTVEGMGGTVNIDAPNSITLERGSEISSSATGNGIAGDITISTNGRFELRDRSTVAVSSAGTGAAGTLQISANNVALDNSTISADTSSGGGGNIHLTSDDSLQLQNQSRISATTQEGIGGIVALKVPHSVILNRDSEISSSATGEGGIAGDIEIRTNRLELRDRSGINATTQSGDGGNTNIQAKDLLLLRNNSIISTTAGQAGAGGDGGNIAIAAEFVIGIPQENSDITANAFFGNGGQIRITTNDIVGLEFRPQLTPLSDITAFTANPQLGFAQGRFELITPGIDPSRGLTELPSSLVDPSNQIAAGCPADRGDRFAVTGRGGLPQDPRTTLLPQVVVQDFRTTAESLEVGELGSGGAWGNSNFPSPIVEAQGWVVNEQGEVQLVASTPQVSRSFWTNPIDCVKLKR